MRAILVMALAMVSILCSAQSRFTAGKSYFSIEDFTKVMQFAVDSLKLEQDTAAARVVQALNYRFYTDSRFVAAVKNSKRPIFGVIVKTTFIGAASCFDELKEWDMKDEAEIKLVSMVGPIPKAEKNKNFKAILTNGSIPK